MTTARHLQPVREPMTRERFRERLRERLRLWVGVPLTAEAVVDLVVLTAVDADELVAAGIEEHAHPPSKVFGGGAA